MLLCREVVSAIDSSCLERGAIKLPREKYRMTAFTSDEVLAASVLHVTCRSGTLGQRVLRKHHSRSLASVSLWAGSPFQLVPDVWLRKPHHAMSLPKPFSLSPKLPPSSTEMNFSKYVILFSTLLIQIWLS